MIYIPWKTAFKLIYLIFSKFQIFNIVSNILTWLWPSILCTKENKSNFPMGLRSLINIYSKSASSLARDLMLFVTNNELCIFLYFFIFILYMKSAKQTNKKNNCHMSMKISKHNVSVNPLTTNTPIIEKPVNWNRSLLKRPIIIKLF